MLKFTDKILNGFNVDRAGACEDELEKFIARFGYRKSLTAADLDEIEKNLTWRVWLEDHQFVERVPDKPQLVFSENPGSTVGYCIGLQLEKHDLPTTAHLQIYSNGRPLGSSHLIRLQIMDNGTLDIVQHCSVEDPSGVLIIDKESGGKVQVTHNFITR